MFPPIDHGWLAVDDTRLGCDKRFAAPEESSMTLAAELDGSPLLLRIRAGQELAACIEACFGLRPVSNACADGQLG